MLAYAVTYLFTTALSGAWVWAVARYCGMRFPVADLVITVCLCSALGLLPFRGWLLAAVIMVLILVRVEQADLWPEATLMTAGSVVVWFLGGALALAALVS